ncbi:hypothetical protein H0H93_010112 [Arthromyces matolae]|nr:hypothetical protein H0H93_010112 [Arthromyces matolae]
MTNKLSDVPPPFGTSNVIDLISVDNSKIIKVSLYSGRAEITRLYKFSVKTGQNQVNIIGLPNALDNDSIRVEGRGNATIHDVTLSNIPSASDSKSTSETLLQLSDMKDSLSQEHQRAKMSKDILEDYLFTADMQHTDMGAFDSALRHYNEQATSLDQKMNRIQRELAELDRQIEGEQDRIDKEAKSARNDKLGMRVSISVFAPQEGEVAIALIYAVASATWKAIYDIRVDMQTKEHKFVKLIYKAEISQHTGESWDNVHLTLETATPTFGLRIPTLKSWNLSPYQPPALKKTIVPLGSQVRHRSILPASMDVDEDELMSYMGLDVTSKGGVSATFQVPGEITIPSDGNPHKVTVTELDLEAEMSWVAVPKVEGGKVHLKAKVKNASEYTFVPGVGNVYVDGSFISRSDVPLVSPQETFDCPLGLDPSIRVKYHPPTKSASHQFGFVSKSTTTHTFSQYITVHNTKSTAIENLKVCEQFPVSQDSEIVVKYLNPPLIVPSDPESGSVGGKEDNAKALAPMKIAEGVMAQWEGVEHLHDVTMKLPGRDGKFGGLRGVDLTC